MRALLSAVIVLSAALAACPKSEPTGADAASGAPAMPSGTTSATASAMPSATTADTATATSDASASDAATATATATATKDAGGAVAAEDPKCGKKPLPDCPLQGWMKANVNPPIAAGDTAALATALDKAASFAPAGYTNWASIAKDGAKAAKDGKLDAAKASCRTCHDQYRDKYRKEMRGRKI